MPEAFVTRSQFSDDGELAVIHRPTGQRYSTYRYEHPDDVSEVIGGGLQNERDAEGNDYDTGEIANMAFVLLKRKVAKLRATPPTPS